MNKRENPKILIVTTPIRPVPNDFPPVGSLSVITFLKRAGFDDTEFYNIDLLRPEYLEVIEYIKEINPDILGISAVVSTAYEYTKKLSLDIKKLLPETTIILGGNLGASAEILLRKTGIDFVCTGEGEVTMIDFAKTWVTANDKNVFSSVKGLAFLNDEEELVVTEYPDAIPAEEVYNVDWSILEDLDQMSFFVIQKELYANLDNMFSHDPRASEPHRDKKTVFNLQGSKGCVARCTFCHRWDKGIRYIPVPVLMRRIDHLVRKHNLGFIIFGDENFGSDKRWLKEFMREIKERDLLWRVTGIRVNTLSSELVTQMKETGCVSLTCGMESGSQKILDVMEKKTTVQQNMDAVRWIIENKLHTNVQLVIGMPGESPETIEDTCKFVGYFAEQSPEVNPMSLSINFAQALPGTPLYEIGRAESQIGRSLSEEEEYLLKISDRDARDGKTYINFTNYPKLLVEKWHWKIQNHSRHYYLRKWGLKNYFKVIVKAPRFQQPEQEKENITCGSVENESDSGYFAGPARINKSIKLVDNKTPSFWRLLKERKFGDMAWFFPEFFWRIRHFSILLVLINSFCKFGGRFTFSMLLEYLQWKILVFFSISISQSIKEYISLRKILRQNSAQKIITDDPAMTKLRLGR
jgi:anaerobic magnesium-protoporphyrin IX monomethyl ester cyclase